MSGLPAGDVERLHAAARAIRDRTPAQAERLLGEVLARHPAHAEALRLLAILQLHTQRAPEAVATLQEAIARHPGDALLHADLGNAHSARGERDAAIAAWRRATGLDPDAGGPGTADPGTAHADAGTGGANPPSTPPNGGGG